MNHSFSLHCFLFKCSIPFQCFWWLNDSMLMLATVKKKKKGCDFIYIWTWGLWVIQDEWTVAVLVFTWAGWLYVEIFECQNEIKTEPQNVGLEIPAEWAWFCANPKPRWSNSCVLFCQLSVYGEGYCMWEYSLSFLERIIIK